MEINKTLTTVEDKIRFIAEQQFVPQGINYFFMNWSQVNVVADKVTTPTIVYVLPASGNLDINHRRSTVYDEPDPLFAFLAPSDFDFEGQINDDVVENMKRLAIAFVEAMNLSGMFEPIENKLPYNVVYDYLDDNVTGITIEPKIKETIGIALCQERLQEGKINLFESLFGYNLVTRDNGQKTR